MKSYHAVQWSEWLDASSCALHKIESPFQTPKSDQNGVIAHVDWKRVMPCRVHKSAPTLASTLFCVLCVLKIWRTRALFCSNTFRLQQQFFQLMKRKQSSFTSERDAKRPKTGPKLMNPQFEAQVGILEFASSNLQAIHGTIKQRFEDFLVYELDEKNNIVHFTSTEVPVCKYIVVIINFLEG